jgi:superfamily II DNA or RNA helicase
MSIDSPTQTAQLNGPTHRSYQVRTAAALLSNPDTHHIVNIPVGGGKTETALEYIAAAYNDTPDSYTALITCPNGRLQSQWKARIEEYDLTDHLDLYVNEKASTKTRQTKTHFRASDSGGKSLRDRKQRLKEWEDDSFSQSKQQSIAAADIVLSTHQLLKSDIDNGRFDAEFLNTQTTDLIVDEVTNFLAVDQQPGFSDTANSPREYRLSKYYAPYANDLSSPSSPRLIGLTGLIGPRIDGIQSLFDTTLIRPDLDAINEYRPDVSTVGPHTTAGGGIERLLEGLQAQFQTAKTRLYRLVGDNIDAEHITIDHLQHYAQQSGKPAHTAQHAFKIKSMVSRLREGTYQSLHPHQDTLIDYVGQVANRFEPVDPDDLKTAFSEGHHAGADETGQGGQWESLFPTAKERGIRRLHTQFLEEDHQSVVFVRHIDTAESLPAILPGDTAVITGAVDSSSQEDILKRYTDGSLDTVVMTYSVGAEGLDLATAKHVVLLGLPQNKEQYHNAVGRVRRGEGPKYEHPLLYMSDDYTTEMKQYERLTDSAFPADSLAPEPDVDAVQQIKDTLN